MYFCPHRLCKPLHFCRVLPFSPVMKFHSSRINVAAQVKSSEPQAKGCSPRDESILRSLVCQRPADEGGGGGRKSVVVVPEAQQLLMQSQNSFFLNEHVVSYAVLLSLACPICACLFW